MSYLQDVFKKGLLTISIWVCFNTLEKKQDKPIKFKSKNPIWYQNYNECFIIFNLFLKHKYFFHQIRENWKTFKFCHLPCFGTAYIALSEYAFLQRSILSISWKFWNIIIQSTSLRDADFFIGRILLGFFLSWRIQFSANLIYRRSNTWRKIRNKNQLHC